MRIPLPRPFSLSQIAYYSHSILQLSDEGCGEQAVLYITTDSRMVERGDLFVALAGEHLDGSAFLMDAISRGAGAVMCGSHTEVPDTICALVCPDVRMALESWASWYRAEVNPYVIAVTGSVGKTTTRHLLSCILSQKGITHEAQQNYNNLLGNILTILTMPQNTAYLVAECGMDGKGQIQKISRLLRPNTAIITNIGDSHFEKLGSREAICLAKMEIRDGMSGGYLYYNGEDPLLRQYAPQLSCPVYMKPMGQRPCVSDVQETEVGISFAYHGRWCNLPHIQIPSHGKHLASCATFAIAVAETIGASKEQITHGCLAYTPVGDRQAIVSYGNTIVINDTYNASPLAMYAARDTLSYLKDSHPNYEVIAVLGDMLELGDKTEAHHSEVGFAFGEMCTRIIAIGKHRTLYALGVGRSSMNQNHLYLFESASCEAIFSLLTQMKEKKIVLFKGSHATPLAFLAHAYIQHLHTVYQSEAT